MKTMSSKSKYRVTDQGTAEYSDDEYDEISSDSYFTVGNATRNQKQINKLEDLPWFHPGMTRNTCEALLLSNGKEGSYLLRKSSDEKVHYTVSVRCKDSVKHYALYHHLFTNTYSFGMGSFDNLKELIDHFKCVPELESESGLSVSLQYPYKKDVPEPTCYEQVTRHAELKTKSSFEMENSENSLDLQIASKEGYLIKRGAIHKNWKKRWFVLQRNLLKYYKEKDESEPIKVINLAEAMHAVEDFIDNKKNCFRLSVPNRIFYFNASSQSEAKSWMELLQWKIEYYQNRKKNTSPISCERKRENETLFVSFPAIH